MSCVLCLCNPPSTATGTLFLLTQFFVEWCTCPYTQYELNFPFPSVTLSLFLHMIIPIILHIIVIILFLCFCTCITVMFCFYLFCVIVLSLYCQLIVSFCIAFYGSTLVQALPFGAILSSDKLDINNQVVRKTKIAVESDVKNWAYISLR